MQLAAFADRVGATIAGQDGDSLAQLLSLTVGCAGVDLRSLTTQQVAQTCHNKMARFDAYAEVVSGIMQARKYLDAQSFADAYSAQIGAVMYASGQDRTGCPADSHRGIFIVCYLLCRLQQVHGSF